MRDQHRVTQLAVLRALISVVETVPQFLPPHLPSLFTGAVLLSDSLRVIEKEAAVPVKEELERLDIGISVRVAPRLFVPSASKAVAQCTRASEILVLLAALKSSIVQAPSSAVSAQKSFLLSSVTKAFDFEGSWEERSSLVQAACDLLDAFVLKLSEVQLRRVFLSLREWRGDLDVNDPEQLGNKAFCLLVCVRTP